MVDVFEIRGKVDLDLEPFTSKIVTANEQLAELGNGVNLNFLEKNDFLGKIDLLKDKLGQVGIEAEKISTAFTKMEGLENLLEKLNLVKERVETVKTEVASVGTEMKKVGESATVVKEHMTGWATEIAKLTEGIVSLMSKEEFSNYILEQQESEIGQINAKWRETQQLVQSNTIFMKEMGASASNVATYFIRENELLESSLTFLKQKKSEEVSYSSQVTKSFSSLMKLSSELERQVMITQRRATALGQIGREIIKQGSEIKKNLTYEEEMVATENLFRESIGESIAEKFRLNAEIQKSNELYMQNLEMEKASANLEREMVTFLTEEDGLLQKITGSHEKAMMSIKEELALEERKLGVIEEETAMLNEQGAVRQRNAMKGNQLDKMGYLPSRITSMALTMWGFNEIMDIYGKSMQNMNALGQQKTYTDLMKTDNRYLKQTNQNVSDVTSGINKMNKAINESYKGGMSLQKMYQKVDMQSVGANAMDSAFKYGVQADKLDELTEVMAIYGSEFVRQGRSQEDSILAVNDALDGEYRRLKEVNIGKEELEAHGYKEGDTVSMITALREIAQERGYDVVAQKVTNLSDAITVLEIRIAQDLVGAFKVLEPILTEVANDFIYMLDTFEWAWSGVRDIWNDFTTELDKTFGVQNVQKYGGGLLKLVGWVITLGITFGVVYKIVSSLKGMLGGLFNIFGKGTDEIAKTTGDIAKTGGTVGKDSGGGFKDNFMKQWSKTGKDIGKMARVFADVVVGMAMAFVVIEEAILIISGIGYTYDALKPQFESGIEFIKEFGVWFALLGGAMLVLSYALDKVSDSAMQGVTKGATKLATGMAIAIGLVAEAIGLLIAPMLAIALLGGTASFLGTNLDKGLEVISWIGNALHQIDLPVALFIGGFLAISLLLGLVQPLTLALAVGIASALLLVTEAIVMLIPPLSAIALLGGTASMLGQDKIQQGADALKIVAQALKTIAEAVPYLLAVDIGVLGQELMDWGSKLITGKDGLTYLSEEIIPNLSTFVESFNNATINPINETTVANLSQVASQLPTIKSAIDTIRTTIGNGGTGGINVLGFQIGGDTSSLKPKLDILYEDIKAVIDFANKFGNSTDSTNATTGVTQMANAVAQLQAKINLMITTITGASPKVKEASKSLGSAIKVGFNEGSNGFNNTVITTLANGIREVQSRYPTWKSGGEASAKKLAEGFKKISDKFKSIISTEMGYALAELDKYKDDFYKKGKSLGSELTRGYQDGADIHSPGLIARTTARELRYTMDALDVGKQMMYQGGVALGQALTNGYNSYGNLRTDVGVLANKGVSNEQLQATARNVQANNNNKGQVVKSFNPTVNIDMSNSTIIGVDDLDARIKASIDRAFVEYNSPNGAVGY